MRKWRRILHHNDLENRIAYTMLHTGRYRDIIVNHEYSFISGGKRVFGEADVIGITHKGNVVVYEVKTTNSTKHYNKAVQQLYRDRKYLMINRQKFGLKDAPLISMVYVANNRVRKVT